MIYVTKHKIIIIIFIYIELQLLTRIFGCFDKLNRMATKPNWTESSLT